MMGPSPQDDTTSTNEIQEQDSTLVKEISRTRRTKSIQIIVDRFLNYITESRYRNLNIVTNLILSNNQLEVVPKCLYIGLKKLKLLDLSHNLIKEFEVQPACHSSLEKLYINNNEIKNLPMWILAQRCDNLMELNYSFNRLDKLKSLMNCYDYKLKIITMENCLLRDEDFEFLKNIPLLEELNISNKIGIEKRLNVFEDLDQLFEGFRWKQLQVLNANNLSLPIFPEGIVWLETIRELYLSHNHLSFLSEDLGYLQNLEVLDVSNNELDYLPNTLSLCYYLRVLKAANNKIHTINDTLCTDYLEVLDLYNNKLKEFPFLNQIHTISHLDLEANYLNTKDEMCSFYDQYLEKKNAYRHDNNNMLRGNGYLLPEESSYDSDSSGTTDSDIFNDTASAGGIQEYDPSQFVSWDSPDPDHEKHPDITSSDDEWQGENPERATSLENYFVIKKVKKKKYLICDYEYCDAEDIYFINQTSDS